MPVELSASISIRHGDMVNFGTLMRLEDAVAGITTDGLYEVGDFIEFQLELTGWDATVSGIAEVRRADLREGHANRYLLQILEMRRSDRKLLQSWYEDLSAIEEDEGEFAPFALDSEVGSYAPPRAAPHLPRPPVGGPPVNTPAEQRSNWMNDRALTISQTVEHQGSRRQALRAVLRAAFSEHAERGPHEQAGGEDVPPKTMVRLGSGLPRVDLVYEDDTSWRAAWTAWLHQGLAFVRYTESVPVLEQQALVRLRYRSFVDVTCPARVVVVHKTGFGMVLDLDPLQLDALESVTEEAHLGRVRVADRLEYDPGKESTSPASRSFWSRLFGLSTSEDPLDAAIRALPDPLAALELDHPRDRHRLDAILAKADTDYLVLCDEVARFLGRTRWRWEELEARTRGSSKPIDQAAAFLVLAHVTRSEAVAAVRWASATSTPEEVRITIEPSPDASCAVCRRWHGAPTSPLNLARRGLPPYHVGCECRVVRVKEE